MRESGPLNRNAKYLIWLERKTYLKKYLKTGGKVAIYGDLLDYRLAIVTKRPQSTVVKHLNNIHVVFYIVFGVMVTKEHTTIKTQ